MSRFNNITFYTSVNDVRDLPLHTGIEIAFAGRSNAGKSSAINTLTNRSRLAFVSKTPGRTQLINYFQLNSDQFFVDLPGYGYAKVPDSIRQHWQSLLSRYLQTREPLKGLVLIMDIRHPLKPLDIEMLDWFAPTGKAIHILLTKSDKLSTQRANITLKDVTLYLKSAYPQCSVQLFSSLSATGVEDATTVISDWLETKISS
ncbi:ribosome biogenesis GTP-binding protein YihA/YsxC [Nitrosomonas sp.]|uniref:ribosome biogenesis GTP-binding protein YihA/YsxC n=1 Tax=Nitrosomonas sp. TaxID=42353 RepID=UPI0025DE9EB3|nr:ribosome biogenesis GTP-binding protein YihA/YsxC [Nitrosomonas sp.]MBY0483398.1 ribosome biogenesis GTP-binding protein YihA/YsxC [Nitrosomonas sp.]